MTMKPSALVPAAGAAALLAACAGVPSPLLQPTGETLVTTLSARGVQIYACRGEAGAAPAWTFVAPEAELFDTQGRVAGSHGAGPFWQANDGSRITGSVKARTGAPRAGAIPWLLLATRPGNVTTGVFSDVSSVQRLNTEGGVAPAAPCTAAELGRVVRVPYSADYSFYSSR